jgi:Cu/Ag efflux pump CusA
MEFGPDLVVRGAVERMKPVVITVLGIGIAFLPVLFTGATPGLEILHPMVVVSLGGLITTTIFSLLVVPALYMRFGQRVEPANERAFESGQAATQSQS